MYKTKKSAIHYKLIKKGPSKMFKQWKNQNLFLLLGVSVAIATTGCATGVVTSLHTEPTSEGVSYYLPRNDVRVVFTNTTIASEIRVATKVLEGAKKEEMAAAEALERAKNALKEADPMKPEVVKEYQKLVEAAEKTKAAAKNKRLKAVTDLTEKEGTREQILIEVLPPVPDTSQLYVATLEHSIFYDDTVKFKTSSEGLLTQVTYKGADQTGEVIQNLVETGIEAAKLYARLHGLPITTTPESATGEPEFTAADPEECKPKKTDDEYYYEFTIDPSNPEAVAKVNRKLIEEASLPFLLNILAPAETSKVPVKIDKKKGRYAGLFYRRAIPYTVEILEDPEQKMEICRIIKSNPSAPKVQIKRIQNELEKRAAQIPTSQSKQVLMTAGGPIALLKFDAGPFVTTDLQATFKQGVLLESSETRPSEGVGFTMIPLNALRAVGETVGSIVNNILPIKIDYTNKNRELIEAETELQKAKQANAELQKKVLDQFESGD